MNAEAADVRAGQWPRSTAATGVPSLLAAFLALTAVANLTALVATDRLTAVEGVSNGIGTLAAVALGWLLVVRRANGIGWLLLVLPADAAMAVLDWYVRGGAPDGSVGTLPGAALVAWASELVWFPLMALVVVGFPLLFPDGRLPSPRWRWVAWLGAVTVGIGVVQTALRPTLYGYAAVASPMARLGVPERFLNVMDVLLLPLSVVALGAALAAPVVRWRRADVVVRQQLKWVLSGIVVLVALTVLVNTQALSPSPAIVTLFGIGKAVFPATVAVAIMRYRLYEIDRIISRTVSYTLLTGLLVAVYLGAVVGLQQVFSPVTGESELAVAGATLAVAALFGPARRRLQTAVDRRFNRARYDAQRTVDAFRAHVRQHMDLDELGSHLIETVRNTVEPAQTSLWLRPHDGGPSRSGRSLA